MKTITLYMFALMSMTIAACSDNTGRHSDSALTTSNNSVAIEMPVLAKNNGCVWCHAIDKKVVGPAWMDVSKFYNGKMDKSAAGKSVKEATGGKTPEEWLEQKVSQGGSGNWGTTPMLANDPSGAKNAQIKELVGFVLGLAK
jgi:cytochrome c551/c552